MSIFRKEVTEKQTQRLYGDVRIDTPLSHWAITLLLAVLFSSIVLFLIFASYSRKQTVVGWLTPDQGLVRISSPQRAIVTGILATQGEQVEAGAALLTLGVNHTLPDGRRATDAQLESITVQYNEISSHLESLDGDFENKKNQLFENLKILKAERASILDQHTAQKARIKIASEILNRYRALLAENNASELEVLTHEETLLVLTQSQAELTRQKLSLDRQLQQAEGNLKALPTEKQAEKLALIGQLETLARQRTDYEASRSLVLKAPISASIAAATVKVGQATDRDRLLMMLIPEGGVLQVELFVPTRAAGFIKPGQPVNVRIDAFPHQKFGVLPGIVRTISASPFDTSELPISIQSTDPVYRVVADLKAQAIGVNGDLRPLQAGMLLKADILLERRRLWRLFQSGA